MLAYMMKFNTVKPDDILMLDFLEELNLLGNCLKGAGVLLLDGNLTRGAGEKVRGEGRSNMQNHLFVSANLFDGVDFTRIQVETLVNLSKSTFTCISITTQ